MPEPLFSPQSSAEARGGLETRDALSEIILPAEPMVTGLVSVVIPAYNRSGLLRRAVESALSQTYRHVEVIVVDDGSTDDTARVAREFGESVRYIHQSNAGVTAARNRGLLACRGEFIAFLDSDDAWMPWKLAAQVAVLRRIPEAGMVWTDMVAVDPEDRVLDAAYLRKFYDAYAYARIEDLCEPRGPLSSLWPEAPREVGGFSVYAGDIFSGMLLGNLVHTSTVVIRRERLAAIGGFDQSFVRSGEDYEFHMRTSHAGPVAFLDGPSILYRVGAPDQLTAPWRSLEIARNNLRAVTRWLERGRGRHSLRAAQVRARLARSHAWLGEAELEAGNEAAGRRHLWKAVLLRPRQARHFALLVFALLPASLRTAARRLKRGLRGDSST